MEWININEALPEYSERVLVLGIKEGENNTIDYLIDIADRRFTNKVGHYWMNNNDTLRPWKITHWMPLPLLPKAKEL